MDEVFPISARSGEGLEPLLARLAELMPEGPLLYPTEQRSDQPSEVLLAELVREQVLNRTRDEIPHSVEVAVSEVEPPRRRAGDGPGRGLGRVRVPEGDPDRRGGQQGEGDRQRRPPAPCPPRSKASKVARVTPAGTDQVCTAPV